MEFVISVISVVRRRQVLLRERRKRDGGRQRIFLLSDVMSFFTTVRVLAMTWVRHCNYERKMMRNSSHTS